MAPRDAFPTFPFVPAVKNLRDNFDGLHNRRSGAVEEFVPIRKNDFSVADRSQLEPGQEALVTGAGSGGS